MLSLILLLVVILPIAWCRSEFHANRNLRISLGIAAIAMSFGVAFVVGSLDRLRSNIYFSEATKDLIQNTIVQLEAGNANSVLAELTRLKLGSFETKLYLVDVHYNMGPKERSESRDGIVRPYSFQVRTLGDDPELVQVLDFEWGYSNGKLLTAAVGEMTRGGHANYGIVDPESDFESIKKKGLGILNR